MESHRQCKTPGKAPNRWLGSRIQPGAQPVGSTKNEKIVTPNTCCGRVDTVVGGCCLTYLECGVSAERLHLVHHPVSVVECSDAPSAASRQQNVGSIREVCGVYQVVHHGFDDQVSRKLKAIGQYPRPGLKSHVRVATAVRKVHSVPRAEGVEISGSEDIVVVHERFRVVLARSIRSFCLCSKHIF